MNVNCGPPDCDPSTLVGGYVYFGAMWITKAIPSSETSV